LCHEGAVETLHSGINLATFITRQEDASLFRGKVNNSSSQKEDASLSGSAEMERKT
jgi:hypothetical protein